MLFRSAASCVSTSNLFAPKPCVAAVTASPLRIALEATCACDPTPTGMARYAANLSRALARRSDVEPVVMTRLHRWKYRAHRLQVPDARHVWWQSGVWPWSPWSVDVVHGLEQRTPRWWSAPRIATFHDIMWELPISREWGGDPSPKRDHARLTKLMGELDHFIAVSETTKNDLVQQRGIDPARIAVVLEGVDPSFRPHTAAECAPVRARFDLARPYVLHVGLCDPRKNLVRLVEAFAHSGLARDFDLVLVGGRGGAWPAIESAIVRTGLAGRVHSLAYVPDDQLPALYAGAAALAFPSLYEGFGLPVLEAMASGVPVLTSNRSGTAEVAGRHAELVDPLAVDAIAQGLWRVVDMSAERREAARQHAAGFTWDQAAAQCVELYRTVMARR
jgi:alpha-1,3-rhamnosyl/mannosyltransferase